jgi:NAD-dependent dihydropyrimidine dehydrogenase PreA subunit
MKRLRKFLWETFHTLFRNFNFPCELGLARIGNPNEDSPVFLSGNYTLVVDRLKRALKGANCYLLIANSRGSNVWCAAGMNEFSEHDVIDAINVAGLWNLVRHRQIIAPPYAAPGVDVRAVLRETGFNLKWGPTHLNDLPRYIASGYKRTHDMISVQFGMRDRIEQALANSCCYAMTIIAAALFWPAYILTVIGIIVATYLFAFACWNVFPNERRWRHTLMIAVTLSAPLAVFGWWANWNPAQFALWGATLMGVVLLMAMDACGSTPIYKTTIGHWLTNGDYKSLFNPVIDPARCTNCMNCVLVCPKNVFAARRNGVRKVVSINPGECIDCLACVKQCYDDAFYNRSGQYKGDVKSIPNLHEIMTRDWSHLESESRWLNHPIVIRNGLPVLDTSGYEPSVEPVALRVAP